jgi:hypothetical protein
MKKNVNKNGEEGRVGILKFFTTSPTGGGKFGFHATSSSFDDHNAGI